jgi:hypothetical protein
MGAQIQKYPLFDRSPETVNGLLKQEKEKQPYSHPLRLNSVVFETML